MPLHKRSHLVPDSYVIHSLQGLQFSITAIYRGSWVYARSLTCVLLVTSGHFMSGGTATKRTYPIFLS